MTKARTWTLLGLILAIGLGARLVLALAHTTMEADEFIYARMAQDLVGETPGNHILVEPILFPLTLIPAHLLTGDWEWGGRAISLLASAGMLLAVMGFGRSIFSLPTGLAAAALLALYPPLVDFGARPMTEPLYHFLLVLVGWQAWRVLRHYAEDGASVQGMLQCALLGLATGLASLARREGRWYFLALSAALVLLLASRRRWRDAVAAPAVFLATGMAMLLPSRWVLDRARSVPRALLDPAALAGLAGRLLGPLLSPALLAPAAPARESRDGVRWLTFGAMLSLAPLVLVFPDPGRKATALVPFVALLAAEGAFRWGRTPPVRAALLGAAWICLVAQGVSTPMMPHFVPPWTDRAESRQAGEWLRSRLRAGEPLAAFDESIFYYAGSANGVYLAPRRDLPTYVERLRARGVRWLVVDRRSRCRANPVLDELGRNPASRPGMRLEAVFPLRLTPLNSLLSRPLRSKGLRPDERAVVYSVEPG